MTLVAVTPLEAEGEARWRDWQARGAEADQRSARTARRLIAFIALCLTVSLILQVL